MKRLILASLIIIPIIGAVTFLAFELASSVADAGSVSHASGSGAHVGFFNIANGTETSAFVSAEDFTFQSPPGGGSTGSDVSVDFFQFDAGTGRIASFFGSSQLDPAGFQIDRRLTTATLNTVIEVCGSVFDPTMSPPDGPFECFDVTIDLTWTGDGALGSSSGHSHTRFDGFIDNSRFASSFRNALVSGSLTGGIVDVSGDDAEFAEMFKFRSGEVFID